MIIYYKQVYHFSKIVSNYSDGWNYIDYRITLNEVIDVSSFNKLYYILIILFLLTVLIYDSKQYIKLALAFSMNDIININTVCYFLSNEIELCYRKMKSIYLKKKSKWKVEWLNELVFSISFWEKFSEFVISFYCFSRLSQTYYALLSDTHISIALEMIQYSYISNKN